MPGDFSTKGQVSKCPKCPSAPCAEAWARPRSASASGGRTFIWTLGRTRVLLGKMTRHPNDSHFSVKYRVILSTKAGVQMSQMSFRTGTGYQVPGSYAKAWHRPKPFTSNTGYFTSHLTQENKNTKYPVLMPNF